MNDQRSVTEQLQDLIRLANEKGMYDAADWLRARIPVWPAVPDVKYAVTLHLITGRYGIARVRDGRVVQDFLEEDARRACELLNAETKREERIEKAIKEKVDDASKSWCWCSDYQSSGVPCPPGTCPNAPKTAYVDEPGQREADEP